MFSKGNENRATPTYTTDIGEVSDEHEPSSYDGLQNTVERISVADPDHTSDDGTIYHLEYALFEACLSGDVDTARQILDLNVITLSRIFPAGGIAPPG